MEYSADFQALLASFGRQLAQRQWPQVGDIVVITATWDGPNLYGSDKCLSVATGEHVEVLYRNSDGWLYGKVQAEQDFPERSGWFGGKGCTAVLDVTLPVPLGPALPTAKVPAGLPGELGGTEEPASPEVEAYIARYRIDASAGQALRELEPALQTQVMETGLTNCRNPSAVLLCRIDRVKEGREASPGVYGQPQAQAVVPAAQARSRSPRRRAAAAVPPASFAAPVEAVFESTLPDEVEEFIVMYDIDERAAQALRDAPPEHQAAVIAVELSNCRCPSAVVNSRVLSLAAAQTSTSAVESYIQENDLDEKCAAELRQLSPGEQQQVMEVRMTNARNPSAVVKSRIQAVKSQGQEQHRLLQVTEDYLVRHGIDESVGEQLRAFPQELQMQIIASDLSNCRNPTAVLLSRMRNAEVGMSRGLATAVPAQVPVPMPVRRPPPPAPVPAPHPGDSELEAFIQRNFIDEQAAEALRGLPPDRQVQVMERGDLVNCRNPSKVLLSRIRAV